MANKHHIATYALSLFIAFIEQGQ